MPLKPRPGPMTCAPKTHKRMKTLGDTLIAPAKWKEKLSEA